LTQDYEIEAIGDFYLQGITGFDLDSIELKTVQHLAPEFISKGAQFDRKSDIW